MFTNQKETKKRDRLQSFHTFPQLCYIQDLNILGHKDRAVQVI